MAHVRPTINRVVLDAVAPALEGAPPDFKVKLLLEQHVPGTIVLDLDALPTEGEARRDVVLYEPDLSPPYTVLTGRPVGELEERPTPRLPTAAAHSAELYVVDLINSTITGVGAIVTLSAVDEGTGDPLLEEPLWRWSADEGVVDATAEADDDDAPPAPSTTVVDGDLEDDDVEALGGDPNNPLSYVLPAPCPESGERRIGSKAGDPYICPRCSAPLELERFPDGDHPLSAMVPAHAAREDYVEEVELPEPNTAPPTGGELADVGKIIELLDHALRGSPVEVEVVVTGGSGEVVGRIVNTGWGHVFRSSERSDRLVGVHSLSRNTVLALATGAAPELLDRVLA